MMLNRLLIVPGVEHTMRNIGVHVCLLVLRHRGFMVLQVSRIMSASGILWSTPSVHISGGGRHWKARSLIWNLLILLSGDPEVVWWWLLLRKPRSWALSLTASSVVNSLSLLRPVSLSLGAILWPSELLSSCVCFSILIRMGVLILWVCFLVVADIIAPKLTIIFCTLIRLGSFQECWQSPNVTAIPKGAPSPDRENYRPISITPILSKMYEKFVSHKLSCFCKQCGLLPAAQLLIGKVWAALMHCLPYLITFRNP